MRIGTGPDEFSKNKIYFEMIMTDTLQRGGVAYVRTEEEKNKE